MANIGIFYGSSTGNTSSVAEKIAKLFTGNTVQTHDVASATADFAPYDLVIFGTSTWGLGDLQDDWDSFADSLKTADLTGKKVALFGLGDSSSYSDTFCDGVAKIYDIIKSQSIQLLGRTSPEGYSYDSSECLIDGQHIGLLLDEDNEPELTEQRLALWVEDLKKGI